MLPAVRTPPLRLFSPFRKLSVFLLRYMHLPYSLQHIQLRLDIFLRRQRATLLPLSDEDTKLYDASFQYLQEHLILLHVIPH